MPDHETLLARLTDKDATAACAYAQAAAAQSRESDQFYPYLNDFASLLHHPNSLVRNRAISLLAANARWDSKDRYDDLISEFLCHITDEKPITARQCMQALPEIAAAKPDLIPRIRAALEQANFSSFRESMRPLLLKDRANALQQLAQQEMRFSPITEGELRIRPLVEEEIGAALDLAWEVFKEFEAPDYAPQGAKAFYASIHAPAYLAQLRIYGAFAGDALLGILATRSSGTHIALFFVRGAYHRQGVGKQLFLRACQESPAEQMTVNSSPYAVEIYRRLGFCETDAEQTLDGIRYTPMRCTIPRAARAKPPKPLL